MTGVEISQWFHNFLKNLKLLGKLPSFTVNFVASTCPYLSRFLGVEEILDDFNANRFGGVI